jgi:putative oxygen-independent coproporphyrinogen III oxidase
LIDAYVEACITDLRRGYDRAVAPHDALPSATSVFVGGGTPSLIPADALARILTAIPTTPDAEVTVECNPDSVDAEKLGVYRDAGVNRVSIGVQSLNPEVLRALGRTHDPDNVARAVAAARAAGIARLNLDLIYGTPGETLAGWQRTLDGAVALEPTHISCYALTVEAGTPLGERVRAGVAASPDDDDQASKYELADELLRAADFEWYEISNWARPGEACRHNLLYWTMGEYLAIGCAAHGNLGGRRFWNVRTPERYIDAISAAASPEVGAEQLDPAGRAEEAFTLALRTAQGAVVDPELAEVTELAAAGLLICHGLRAVLSVRGRLLANDVTARLLLAGAAAGTHYD